MASAPECFHLIECVFMVPGLHEGVYTVLQSVPPQAYACRLQTADKVQRLRAGLLNDDVTQQAQEVLRGDAQERSSLWSFSFTPWEDRNLTPAPEPYKSSRDVSIGFGLHG